MTALNELIEAVERGHIDPSQYHLIPEVFGGPASGWTTVTLVKWIMSDAFEATSAARALHEAVLPGWFWCLDSSNEATVALIAKREDGWHAVQKQETAVDNHSSARAWLLAILRVLAAREAQP